MDLATFSSIINFFILSTAVWLGWYILTRNSRTLITWLTVLTIWSMGGFFLNLLLGANPPPTPAVLPDWLSFLFVFWPSDVFESEWSGWMMGWQVIPAIGFWHHITALLHPGGMTKARKAMVWFVYLVAGSASL